MPCLRMVLRSVDGFGTQGSIERSSLPISSPCSRPVSVSCVVARGDYYSRRVLSHFLLRCQSGLKVAQIARFVGISRATASKQQNVSSKEMVQVAHHRMAGRPHGKMLPRYAGPVAQFLITHPKASRWDILDFIERTWKVRVSTVALYRFMKKYGLDRAQRSLASAADEAAAGAEIVTAEGAAETNLPVPQEEFFLHPRSTPGRSSSCRPQ